MVFLNLLKFFLRYHFEIAQANHQAMAVISSHSSKKKYSDAIKSLKVLYFLNIFIFVHTQCTNKDKNM